MMPAALLRGTKNFIVYFLSRIALATIGLVPARLTAGAGCLLGRIAHRVARRERRIARRQIAAALRLDEGGRRAACLTRGVFAHLGTGAVELARVMRSPDRAPRVDLPETSRRALDEALAVGRGVVFAAGHIGNWELMAAELARLGYPISTVAKPSYDPRFTRLIDHFRDRLGVQAIYRGRPGAATAMLRALKRNRVLGLLIDQDTAVPSVFVPFFGRPAKTPLGAASLALRSRAEVVAGSIRRRADGTHEILIERHALPSDETAATARLTAALEARIRSRPSQWVWFHERWKSRPDAAVAVSREEAA
jgi:KDO2-lipid IV(A) lauroyltransferase